MIGLTLNAPAQRRRGAGGPPPERPTIIWEGAPATRYPTAYPTLSALCKAVHRERGRRALSLHRTVCDYGGCDTFTAFVVRFADEIAPGEFGPERYAFTLAGVGDRLDFLQAVIAASNPDIP